VQNDELDAEFKITYSKKDIGCNHEVLQTLNEIAEKYPEEASYIKLYEGYVYRDLFKIYKFMDDEKNAANHIIATTKSRESFYLHFKQRYPNDGYLIKLFGEEYYLSYTESLKYITDPIEKKMAENMIRSFLAKLENESGKQHIVLKQLRSIFGNDDTDNISAKRYTVLDFETYKKRGADSYKKGDWARLSRSLIKL